MRQTVRIVASLTLLAGGLALAGAAPQGGGAAGKALTDAQFAQRASASELGEINLGRIAAKQATSAEVKKFAERMVQDHTKAGKELLEIAGKKGFPVSAKMDPKHQGMLSKMLALKGAEFDRAYMEHQVRHHTQAVALFKVQASGGKDEDLKAFAAKILPVIQKHLKKAQAISDNL